MRIARLIVALCVAPLVVPAVYFFILGALTGWRLESEEPLWPGQLAVVTLFAYIVTLAAAPPVWGVSRRRALTYRASAVAGLLVGLAAAFVFIVKGFPTGLFMLTGAVGGVVEGLVFRLLLGSKTEAEWTRMSQES